MVIVLLMLEVAEVPHYYITRFTELYQLRNILRPENFALPV